MRESVAKLQRIFPLRSCREAVFRDHARRGRPCIEYEMKRCVGPCCGLVDAPAYAELVHGTALFLRGRSGELVAELKRRMQEAAAEERFEAAARLRNQIAAVERTLDGQQIVVPMIGEEPVAVGGDSGLVNLNRATQAELEELPGIGPVTAEKIIAAREEQPFATLNELVSRDVLTTRQLEDIADLVTVP